MKRALIGHTGFVGSNLLRQGAFTETFNSSNCAELKDKHFDEVWCAGVRAMKWWANQHPDEDWQGIAPLLDCLQAVTCDKFVLISTVDVFSDPSGKNEASLPEKKGLHPYGLHRLEVEKAIWERFPQSLTVRLPGLFGHGLKKNVIYDFLHNNQTEKIHSDACFQFYDLANIFDDCMTALAAGLELVHFAVEPVAVHEVAKIILGRDFINHPQGVSPASYNFQTIHAAIFGAQGVYLQSRATVLRNIKAFVQHERGAQ